MSFSSDDEAEMDPWLARTLARHRAAWAPKDGRPKSVGIEIQTQTDLTDNEKEEEAGESDDVKSVSSVYTASSVSDDEFHSADGDFDSDDFEFLDPMETEMEPAPQPGPGPEVRIAVTSLCIAELPPPYGTVEDRSHHGATLVMQQQPLCVR